MALFKIEPDGRLESIKEHPFRLEREIQFLTEVNLNAVFRLEFVKSEFMLHNFRIDTLAFDKDSGSFVIIEYKRGKNFSVIDQGYAYLSLMLNNKADFILEYNENSQAALKRNDVDWSQSKVIFVSPSFTTYQKEAINFKDLPIELWEIKRYSNQTIIYNQIKTSGAQESVKTIARKDHVVEQVNKEVKVFTEQDHLSKADIATTELYEALKERILGLDENISAQPKKQTIGFKIENQIFCDIVIQNRALKLYLNLKSGDLEDAKKISRDVSNIGHWGNGSYEIKVKDLEDIEYLLSLIKQSVRKNKENMS